MLKIKKRELHPVELEINELISAMKDVDRNTKEYHEMVKSVKILSESVPQGKIDWNCVISSGVKIASILMILKYEEVGHITSKAFGIATSGRV